MEKKINELEERYKKEIKIIFEELSREKCPGIPIRYQGRFGNEISELFHITDYKDYEDYLNILNQIQSYNPKLADELERYLSKEINLISLLSLQSCLEKLPYPGENN